MTVKRALAGVCGFFLAACAYPTTTVEQGSSPAALFFSGAPSGVRVLVDGVDAGDATAFDGRRQLLTVAPGRHSIRVVSSSGDLYSNDVYVGAGARLEIRVD